MNKKVLLFLFWMGVHCTLFSQVGVGTADPDESSILELSSTGKGFLPPRMTASDRSMITAPATGLIVFQTDTPKGYYYYNGTTWLKIASSEQVSVDFRFTQPNGSGTESSSNQWIRVGTFIYRGELMDGLPSAAMAILYTINVGTYHRLRIYDVTNNLAICSSSPFNTGTNASPAVIDLGSITNIPSTLAVFEIQLLATDVTGNTGVPGRQSIGIHSFQMYY